MNVIETKNLTKYYKKIRGIEDITLNVTKGEIFGFLGPNGAGKTTFIRTILGLLNPTYGEAYIFGLNVKKNLIDIKEDVGYIPGDLNLYGHLTGRGFLNYFMSLRDSGMYLIEDLLGIFELPLDRKIKSYSRGMKQKLSIIQAFMHDPDLVIMDEPTNGLDPLIQQKFYSFLKKEKQKGRTMFFSSHILSEVDKVCDRVGIIRNGKIVTLDDIESLKSKSGKIVRVKITEDPEKFTGLKNMRVKDGWIEFTVTKNLDALIKHLGNYAIKDIEIKDASLEDIFLHHYGGNND